jgi:hypothetical protein
LILTAAVDQVILRFCAVQWLMFRRFGGPNGPRFHVKFIWLSARVFLQMIPNMQPKQFNHPEDADNTLDYNYHPQKHIISLLITMK